MNPIPSSSYSADLPYYAFNVAARGLGAGLLLRRFSLLPFTQGALYGGLSGAIYINMEKTESSLGYNNTLIQSAFNTTLS